MHLSSTNETISDYVLAATWSYLHSVPSTGQECLALD